WPTASTTSAGEPSAGAAPSGVLVGEGDGERGRQGAGHDTSGRNQQEEPEGIRNEENDGDKAVAEHVGEPGRVERDRRPYPGPQGDPHQSAEQAERQGDEDENQRRLQGSLGSVLPSGDDRNGKQSDDRQRQRRQNLAQSHPFRVGERNPVDEVGDDEEEGPDTERPPVATPAGRWPRVQCGPVSP